MIMVCQRKAVERRIDQNQYRQENRNMAKFGLKVLVLLGLATCVSGWFLV